MKRIVSLVLALSMVLSMFTFSFAGTGLKDVKGTKYEAAVEALVELGVVDGYADGTYLPEKVVTRNELAKLLVVAYGLETAAEVSTGVTPFADINAVANHWAAGYINVSADYKFVNGYPDGSFKGDNTVTYAEAITMCLRVLGYTNEIESKGTWPTNYIAKAQELGLMEGIEFKSYNDGAKRGDIALLIWNMLRTPMWEITGESEGDGLQSEAKREMLNVKFKDYAYTDKATFQGFEIKDEKDEVKVYVKLDSPVVEQEKVLEHTSYAYAENDFYTFVPGTEVEVLVNEEDKVLLTMVATGSDKLDEGSKDEIDDDYDGLSGEAFDYAYIRAERKNIKAASIISTLSEYVDKVEVRKDFVKLNGTNVNTLQLKDKDFDGALIIKNDERVALRDGDSCILNEGDVITEVTVKFGELDESPVTQKFYVIGSQEAEGTFDRLSSVKYENSALRFNQLKVSKTEYVVDDNATFVEDPEAKTLKVKLLLTDNDSKMEDEEINLVLDAMYGKVVRVLFDGKIDAGNENSSTYKFFATEGFVDRNDAREYFINGKDENSDEAEKIYVAKNSALEEEFMLGYVMGTKLDGSFFLGTFNSDDELKGLEPIAGYTKSGDNSAKKIVTAKTEVLYGEATEDEYFEFAEYTSATFDKNAIVNDANTSNSVKVNDDTVLVKLVLDDKGTIDPTDYEVRVEFEKGIDALKAIRRDHVVIVTDRADTYTRAKYVVVFSDTSDKTGNQVGKITSPDENVLVGGNTIELLDQDNDEVIAKLAEGTRDLSTYQLLVYTLKTNSKDKSTLTYVAGLKDSELEAGNTNHGYVSDGDGRNFIVLGDECDLDDEDVSRELDDWMFVLVNVKDRENGIEGQFDVDTFEVVEYDELSILSDDRISMSNENGEEVIFIIRGMGERTSTSSN